MPTLRHGQKCLQASTDQAWIRGPIGRGLSPQESVVGCPRLRRCGRPKSEALCCLSHVNPSGSHSELYTMNADGGDMRVLVRRDEDGNLQAVQASN